MRLNPYLSFNGQCEAAFNLYARCLGGKIVMMMRYGESPMAEQTRPDFRNRIMHVTMDIGGNILQGADVPPQRYEKPQGVFLWLSIQSLDDSERIFAALSDRAQCKCPCSKPFGRDDLEC